MNVVHHSVSGFMQGCRNSLTPTYWAGKEYNPVTSVNKQPSISPLISSILQHMTGHWWTLNSDGHDRAQQVTQTH